MPVRDAFYLLDATANISSLTISQRLWHYKLLADKILRLPTGNGHSKSHQQPGVKCLLSASSSNEPPTVSVNPRLWTQDQCLFQLPLHQLEPERLVGYRRFVCLENELLWWLAYFAAPNVQFLQYDLPSKSDIVRI